MGGRGRSAPASSPRRSGSSRGISTRGRTRCPAGSSSGSRSRARSPGPRRSSSATSRRRRSTSRSRPRSSTSSSTCRRRRASRTCSSRTTSRSSATSPTGSRSCTSARSSTSGRPSASSSRRTTRTRRRCCRRSRRSPPARGRGSACTGRSRARPTRRRAAASTRAARARSPACAPRPSRRGRTTAPATATAATSPRTTSLARSVADLRAGIVGAGWIAGTHAATLADLDGVTLVATADVVPARAEYEDFREMLARERLDVVLVCTPPDTHREVVERAAEARVAVYLEKPVAHAMDDALALRAAVDAAGIVCAVGYQYRALSFLAGLPRDAALLLGTGISDTVQRSWLGDRARGGSMILERASHLIDLERALGGDVESVSAVEAGDAVSIALRFASGALGTVAVARAPGGPGWRLELAGEDGTVTVELDPAFRAHGAGPDGELAPGSGAHGAGLDVEHAGPPPVRLSLACFVDAAARHDRGAVCSTLGEGVATLAVALAAQEAAERGATVRLD